MYYPIQIPQLLNKKFSEIIPYLEENLAELEEFIICFWQMIFSYERGL